MKESIPEETRTGVNRRRFLQMGTATFAATTIGSTAVGLAQASTRDSYVIREGTADETDVVVIDADSSGPTAVVVGGMHGNEPAGYQAAEEMREWTIDAGKLVLIPEANPTALEAGTLSNDNGNLNRKFPTGETPTTPLARAIWDEITKHDADIVFNLHSSKGIYQEDVGPSGVGQAIYPTTADGARQNAMRTVEYMNENHLDDSRPDYLRFRRGNLITGDRPLLIHKVDHDLQIPGFIVEVTRYDTSLATRTDWTRQIVEHLLSQYSIDRASADSGTDSADDSSTDSGTDSADDSSTDSATDSADGSSTDSAGESADNSSGNDFDELSSSEAFFEQGSTERCRLEQVLAEYEETPWANLVRKLL